MRVSGTKLANADRRLLASMDREDRWQQVKVPISAALWDVWGRYCEVAGISMGRGIAALIALDVQALADGQEEIEERGRLLDLRQAELDSREQELEHREQSLGRRSSRAELERMANQIEPRDPGWSRAPWSSTQDIQFEDVGRNDSCPCGSGLKYKRCHGSSSGPPST